MRRWIILFLLLALLVLGGLWLWDRVQRFPQDFPWTPLDLEQPVGTFTGRKITALGDDPGQCRALLTKADVSLTALPAHTDGATCGYAEAVRLRDGSVDYRPAGLGVRCAVAAGLTVWERAVVEKAAIRHFGARVTTIDHFGSYSCRRLYGRAEGQWSEHASANAVDIAGFRLADGTRVTVVGDWRGSGPKASFLREVRDGACDLFSTVLSPDYNAAHRDHLHFDQAARGAMGGRVCR